MSIGVIVFLTILVAGAIVLILACIKAFIDMHRECGDDELPDEPPAEPVAIGARVLSRRMDIRREGSVKLPRHTRLFYVTFLKDDGTTEELSVPEGSFEYCIPYSTGTLVTINGEFFDFGKGENIE